MQRRLPHRFDSFSAILHTALCIVSVAMLLSFPASRVHSFGTHFRTPTVRRSIERHTSVAHTDDRVSDHLAPSKLLLTFFTPVQPLLRVVTTNESTSPVQSPVISLLSRRKLCPSGSGGQDPLLLVA